MLYEVTTMAEFVEKVKEESGNQIPNYVQDGIQELCAR